MLYGCTSQYFETYPNYISGLWKKTDSFIYLIVHNVDRFIYCPLIYIPIYGWYELDKYSSQFTDYQENKQHLWAKKNIRISRDVRIQIRIKKNRVSHIHFVEKLGLVIYLAALKKGTHIRSMSCIRSYPHHHLPASRPPPPPTHTHTHTLTRVRDFIKNGPNNV